MDEWVSIKVLKSDLEEVKSTLEEMGIMYEEVD